jgi:hypothetical protein
MEDFRYRWKDTFTVGLKEIRFEYVDWIELVPDARCFERRI